LITRFISLIDYKGANMLDEFKQFVATHFPKIATKEEIKNILEVITDHFEHSQQYTPDLFSIHHPMRGPIPFELYDYQRNLLSSYENNRMVVVSTARQMGITSLTSLYLLCKAMNKPEQSIMISSSNSNTARDALDRILYAHKSSSYPLPDVLHKGKGYVQFDNGSCIRISAVNEGALCGLDLNYLFIDNAAFISHSKLDEFLCCAASSTCHGGQIIMVSTPGNQFFTGPYERILLGDDDYWHRVFIDYRDHPRWSQEWEDSVKAMIGQDMFEREYRGSLIQSQT
jgi:hypothetical protein